MSTETKTTVELTRTELDFIREGLAELRRKSRNEILTVPKSQRTIERVRRMKEQSDIRINFLLALDTKLGDAVNLCNKLMA